MPIQPLAPPQCPRCGGEKTLFVNDGQLECSLCGYRETPDALRDEPAAPAASEDPREDLRPSYSISHNGPVDKWARAKFDTGQGCIGRKDWDGAIRAFEQALEYQSDFIDAHLWLARLVEDEAARREHLTTVLAFQPNHLEAMRELMVLDGKMTRQEAERSED